MKKLTAKNAKKDFGAFSGSRNELLFKEEYYEIQKAIETNHSSKPISLILSAATKS